MCFKQLLKFCAKSESFMSPTAMLQVILKMTKSTKAAQTVQEGPQCFFVI